MCWRTDWAADLSPGPVPKDRAHARCWRGNGPRTLVEAVSRNFPGHVRSCSPSRQGRCSVVSAYEADLQALSGRVRELGCGPDGRAEVLCGAALAAKIPDFRGFFAGREPSDGLEPSTPSLPWRIDGVEEGGGKALATSFSPQLSRFGCLVHPSSKGPESPWRASNLSPKSVPKISRGLQSRPGVEPI